MHLDANEPLRNVSLGNQDSCSVNVNDIDFGNFCYEISIEVKAY